MLFFLKYQKNYKNRNFSQNPDLATMNHYTNLESPKCRTCQPCNPANDTEKISLREEANQAEIEAFVQLDSIYKRFMCKLFDNGHVELLKNLTTKMTQRILEQPMNYFI